MAGDPDPDLALISTDPRIAALADGLRQRDGAESLTDTALRLAESSGESVRTLRPWPGLDDRAHSRREAR